MSADVDPDFGLTAYQRTRQALHRSLNVIVERWPDALEDANSRGYPAGVGYNPTGVHGNTENTIVETCALQPSHAVGWLAELADIVDLLRHHVFTDGGKLPRILTPGQLTLYGHVGIDNYLATWPSDAEKNINRIINLANKALAWWPPPPKPGQTANGITVGQRGNTVENCALCDEPAPSGRHPATGKTLNVTDKDGRTLHRHCWYTLRATPIKRPA